MIGLADLGRLAARGAVAALALACVLLWRSHATLKAEHAALLEERARLEVAVAAFSAHAAATNAVLTLREDTKHEVDAALARSRRAAVLAREQAPVRAWADDCVPDAVLRLLREDGNGELRAAGSPAARRDAADSGRPDER